MRFVDESIQVEACESALEIQKIASTAELDDDGKPRRTGNVWTASAHIITAVIGSGVLSLAWGMAQLGWIAGVATLLVFSGITLYTSSFLADCYRSPVTGKRNYTYKEIVKNNLGGLMYVACIVAQYALLCGAMVGYTITAAISMVAIKKSNCFHERGHEASCSVSYNRYVIGMGILEIFLSQIPNFHKLSMLSVVAAVMSFGYSTIGVGLALAKVISGKGEKTTLTGVEVGIGISAADKTWRMFRAFGDIAFAYAYSQVFLEIQDTLKASPPENEVMKRANIVAVATTTTFYLMCGCLGYAAFGNNAAGNLLTGFGFYEPFWLVDLANACIVLHLVGAYQTICGTHYFRTKNPKEAVDLGENMGSENNFQMKVVTGEFGYVLQDVPHLTDYISDLPTYPNPLRSNPAYSVVKQYFVDMDDTVPQKVVVHKDTPRGIHFRRAGPREKVYFSSDEVHACIVTCGGLCPGLNTVIREIVHSLDYMYGVDKVLGIDGGYRGFYSKNTINLTPKVVNDIHKRGGTILGTSRGGHDTIKIVDSIQDRGINQVYIIGGDGTQKGASVIYEEIRKRGLKVAVAGIPKTIDNDIPVIDKSFGFDTAVEEAQRAINAAHVEAESAENGIGVVKLMGRYCGFIAMYATLASRDVDCCLIPESPFYLEGKGGLFEYIEKRLKENGHMVIVIAEGAGQELLTAKNEQDASGNKLLQDVGLWISKKIKEHISLQRKIPITLKYIDPTYMIRAIPSNASDNVYCTLLAQSAVHGAMAGYTGFTSGLVNGRHTYIPFNRITERQNSVVITDRMWARLLSSTNQPSFLSAKQVDEFKKELEPPTQLLDDARNGEDENSGNTDMNINEIKSTMMTE